MAAASGWNAFWLSWLARPKGDRSLFRLIRQRKPRKMMLLGLGDLTRAVRMISLAQRYQQADYIHFAGIDRFDTRPVGAPRLPLKEAHVQLRATRSLINLIPGQPRETLMRRGQCLVWDRVDRGLGRPGCRVDGPIVVLSPASASARRRRAPRGTAGRSARSNDAIPGRIESPGCRLGTATPQGRLTAVFSGPQPIKCPAAGAFPTLVAATITAARTCAVATGLAEEYDIGHP